MMPPRLWLLLLLAAEASCISEPRVAQGSPWRSNSSHGTSECTVPAVDARALSVSALGSRCAASATPLLIRNLLEKPGWRAAAAVLGDRGELLASDLGAVMVRLSVGSYLAQGPEAQSKELDDLKLEFLRKVWGTAGSTEGEDTNAVSGASLGSQVRRQVGMGEARPVVPLGDFVAALGEDGGVPEDVYVFHNVSASVGLSELLAPLQSLWREVTFAYIDRARNPHGDGLESAISKERLRAARRAERQRRRLRATDSEMGPLRSLTRLGVGGTGSGTPFHDHELALNVAFAGRKHWLIAAPETDLIHASPHELLHRILPSTQFQEAWKRLETSKRAWSCTQLPGEVVYLPDRFLHATINLEEGIAAAVQCENTDPRTNLTALNALIVHASEGAGDALGPCGTQWASPWTGLDASQSIEALHELLRQSGEANVRGPDGLAPADVAARWGSVRVAQALATHGAAFVLRHADTAEEYGHRRLAAFIKESLLHN